MQRLSALPPSVSAYLREFAVRRRRLAFVRAAGWSLYGFLLWLLLACAADRLMHLPSWARVVLLCIGAAAATGIFAWPLRGLRRAVDWVEVAESIERRSGCFGQRLVTVTSQLLDEQADHRGSDQILRHLAAEVEQQAAVERCGRPLAIPGALRPWGLTAVAALLVIGLLRVPVLGMPQLLIRFIEPTAPIAPVTTTSLRVMPGDCDVPVAEPLRIDVEAHRLANDAVWIHHNDDGVHWTRSTMESAADGRYVFTIASIQRDVRYYVEAGDATSPFYLARVKRPPVVAEYRIRYTYPAYTEQPPFTVSNTSGLIEAPVGSEAILTVLATEPLESATINVSGQSMPMEPAGANNARQIKLAITRDTTYWLELLAPHDDRPADLEKQHIHAIPDRPPIVRVQQSGRTLQLNPGDGVTLDYQALDDFGLDALTLVVAVNDAPATNIPLKLAGDRKHQEDSIDFDLGPERLKLGDVVTLALAARDNSGQTTRSGSVAILISPRPVDPDTQARIDELDGAVQLAQMLSEELQAARSTDHPGTQAADSGAVESNSAAARHFSAASELASLLRQSLLRTIVHSRTAPMSVALARWMDVAQRLSASADELFRDAGTNSARQKSPPTISSSELDQLAKLLEQLHRTAEGERATAVLYDLENLRAAQASAAQALHSGSTRLTQLLTQMQQDVRGGAVALNLNPEAYDFEQQLRRRASDGDSFLNSVHPIDFPAAAYEWAAQLRTNPLAHLDFDARLLTASAAEAVRPDADLERARDLEITSRAAAYLESQEQANRGKPSTTDALAAFADALATVENARHLAAATRPADQAKTLKTASAAREKITAWAAAARGARSRFAARNNEAQAIAMQANAESAGHNYSRAHELDQALAQTLIDNTRAGAARGGQRGSAEVSSTAPSTQRSEERVGRIQRVHQAVAGSMDAAETADRLEQNQQKLAQDLQSGGLLAGADLAGAQRSVADAIAKAQREHDASLTAATQPTEDDPNWRSRAAGTILKAQEQLSAMPQALTAVQAAAMASHEADLRWRDAQAQAQTASDQQKEMAQRAVEQAAQDAADAAERLKGLLAPLRPQSAADLTASLEAFDPETTTAREVMGRSLIPALTSLIEAADHSDVPTLDNAAASARQAIDVAQSQLARAQDSIMQRDPLASAKWFARAAADSLSRGPGDYKTAMAHQANVTLALSHAWDRAIHRATAQRLAMLPSLAAAYAPAPPTGEKSSALAASPAQNVSLSRQWSQLRPTTPDALNSQMSNPDPPGFEEDLRLYFQAMDKAQEKAK